MVLNHQNRNHRAVATIIATLMLILITAVGGGVTFSYAQDIINDNQVSSSIAIEQLTIVGWDFRDLSELRSHNGLYMKDDSAGIPDGIKSYSERVTIYIQNKGLKSIRIDELRFVGTVYEFAGSSNYMSNFVTNTFPAPEEYVILTITPDIIINSEIPELKAGTIASLVLGLDASFKMGRHAMLKLTTDNGFVIVKNMPIGSSDDTSDIDYMVKTETGEDPGEEVPPPPEEEVPPPPEEEVPPPPEEEGEPQIPCSTNPITFETDALLDPLAAGTEVGSQWHLLDIHINAINNRASHPDKAIIFDSNNPTGGDNDLGRPWKTGNLPSNTDLGNIIIIAEDDVDSNGDGLVDDPDDEAQGGKIIFQSSNSCSTLGFTLIDFEEKEGNSGTLVIILESGGSVNIPFKDFKGVSYGDNSANAVSIPAEDIGGTFKRVEFHFNGSGAIDNVHLG